MEKKNLILIITAAVIIIIGGGLLLNQQFNFWQLKPPVITPEGIILFYGDGCPHCKLVSDFIAANNVKTKVAFTELEVFNNEGNAQILLQKAQICKIDTNQVGVPFLWTTSACLLGDQDVIKFFQDKINASPK
jgi:thiol-disulfide isomerase/thioredoxin